ncbi:MAG: right-handed parallel beta-helix repeat-containing protein, partial [Myxococcales bacterium]|nr:right-handed parallel beta-helix repeat-containing protein [Myxococcales bacterium]
TVTTVPIGRRGAATLVPLSRIVVADQLPQSEIAEIVAPGNNTIAGCEIVGSAPVAGYHFVQDTGGSLLVIWSNFEGRLTPPTRHTGDAIRLTSDGRVRNTRIRGFNRGVSVFGDDALIYQNAIWDCTTGISPIGGNLRIGRNVVASQAGLAASDTAIYLNTVHDNHRGIDLQEIDGVTVSRNVIHDNSQTGVQLTNITITTPLRITDNAIFRNALGIWINQGDAEIHGSDLSCNTNLSFQARDEFEIDARHNGWDHKSAIVHDANNDDQCTQDPIDVCYAGTHAGTPAPLVEPSYLGAGCVIVGIVP